MGCIAKGHVARMTAAAEDYLGAGLVNMAVCGFYGYITFNKNAAADSPFGVL